MHSFGYRPLGIGRIHLFKVPDFSTMYQGPMNEVHDMRLTMLADIHYFDLFPAPG